MEKIIQIIPATRPIVAVYGEQRRVDWIANVDYLGLTDEGEILGLYLGFDGYYDICEGRNFIGLCETTNIQHFLESHKLIKIYNNEKEQKDERG